VPLIGKLIDRWGPRTIGLRGAFLYCVALASLGLVGPSLWGWWGLWGLVALAAVLIQAPVWTAAVASRFNKSRGLALAATFCGGGLASSLMPLIASGLIAELGWRAAYPAMACLLGAVCIPLIFLYFRGASDLPRHMVRDERQLVGLDVREAILSVRFFSLGLASLFLMIPITALLVHFIPILASVGLSQGEAAGAATFIGIGSIVGRLTCGMLLDRMSGALLGAGAFLLPLLVVILLLAFDGQVAVALVIAALLGLSVGSEVDVLAYLTSRYFGLRNFGTLFGILVGIQTIAYAIGPPLAGLLYNRDHAYTTFLLGTVPLFVLSALLVARLGRYPVFQTQPDRQNTG
jgi:MFS family permease